MAYSAEVIQRARARLAQARQDRLAENREHLARAYEQLPTLQQIDRELRLTMAQAARAAFAGGDAVALMEQARQENMALQRRRAALIAEYFEEGYLDDSPICSLCGGSGYVGSNMCECLQELCRQEQKRELTMLSAGAERFDQFRLDYYSDAVDPRLGFSPRQIMEKTFRTCRRYAQTFTPRAESLFFSGNPGLGKTFLSACIARTVAGMGYSVVYETAGRLFSTMEKARFEGGEENRAAARRYSDCELLIIDDLGTEMTGAFVVAALYELVNDRLMEGKPTIISTNLTADDLSRRYSPALASRLRGSYKKVAFVGDDIRLIKNGVR